MDRDNLISRLAKAELLSSLDHKLDQVVGALKRGDLVADHTTGGIKLLHYGE
jgi:hypothetical protein